MYPSDLLEDILRHVDIVDVVRNYIPVEQRGRSFLALCPFHNDSHPSLSISREKQIFKCFVCGAGGNAFSFVSKYEGIPFDEAVRKVAEMVGYRDSRLNKKEVEKKVDATLEPLYKCIADLNAYYRYSLMTKEGEEARKYLEGRNLMAQKDEYGIGYAPLDGKKTIQFLLAKKHSLHSIDSIGITTVMSEESASDRNAGRIIFPLHNPDGQVVGFSARKMSKGGDDPKYINSPETPIFHKGENLFNYHRAKKTSFLEKHVYVMEGFMDVMALERAGISSAVALMGTALTSDQVTLLKRLKCEIRLSLDGDDAGRSGMMRIIPMLRKASLPFRLVDQGSDLRDADEILQADGPEVLKAKMSELVDPFTFELNYYLNTKKLSNSRDKQKVIDHFVPVINSMKPGIEKEDYLAKLSKATGYDVEAIRREAAQKEEDYEGDESGETPLTEARLQRLDQKSKTYKRLALAERQALHYMILSQEAVNYYEKDIGSFYDSLHETIASYISDYVSEKKEAPYLPALIASIEGSGAENADEISQELTSIAEDTDYPGYSLNEMRKCHEAIKEEMVKMNEKNKRAEVLRSEKSDDEKAKLLEEKAKEKYAKLKKAKKA